MRRALALAEKARGETSPNPMVGCVLVRGGKVVGEGFHRRAGSAHAEVEALKKAGARAKGATAYVTLEPCDHVGRTGRCTEALLRAGVKKVVAAMGDPNPLVNGRGFRRLRAAGIAVEVGALEDHARELNEAYICWVTKQRPLVTWKAAMSLDGRMATVTGDSKWISGEESRTEAHRLRAEHDAILVGAGTVRADDPELNTRLVKGRDPIRVILDGNLSISPRAKVARAGTLVLTTKDAPAAKEKALRKKKVEVFRLDGDQGRVDLAAAMRALAKIGITSLLVEGGADVHAQLISAKLVDRVELFLAPKLIGGVPRMKDALELDSVTVCASGDDLQLSGRTSRRSSPR